MGRRWGAVLVVVLALLVVAVISSVARPRLTGRSDIAPPPGPPVVGECVTAEIGGLNGSQSVADGSILSQYAQVTTAPCTGHRFGEVAGVITDPAPLVTTAVAVTDQSGQGAAVSISAVDPNADTCRSAVDAYVATPAAFDGTWTDAESAAAVITAPSDRQQAAGQHWLACIAGPITAPGPDGYFPSLRHAFALGYPAADAITSCGLSATGDDQPAQADCGASHDFEIFGFLDITAATDEHELVPSCRALIEDRMKTGDPTKAGQLTVAVVYYDAEGNPRSDFRGSGSAQCLVRPTGPGRKLTHSLLGLAERSVPVTG